MLDWLNKIGDKKRRALVGTTNKLNWDAYEPAVRDYLLYSLKKEPMAMIINCIYRKPLHQIHNYWPMPRDLFSRCGLARFPLVLFLIAGFCVIMREFCPRERYLEIFLASGYLFLFSWTVPVITWPLEPGEIYVALGIFFYSMCAIVLFLASSLIRYILTESLRMFRRPQDKTL